jgi:VanZ family protein
VPQSSPAPTAARWLWIWGPAIAQMVAIFVASSIPDLTELPLDVPDYVGHFVGYSLLGALLIRAVAQARWVLVTGRAALTAGAIATFYAFTDELHQHFVHGRSPSVVDLTTDAIGAAAAVLAIWVLARVVARVRARTRAV